MDRLVAVVNWLVDGEHSHLHMRTQRVIPVEGGKKTMRNKAMLVRKRA